MSWYFSIFIFRYNSPDSFLHQGQQKTETLKPAAVVLEFVLERASFCRPSHREHSQQELVLCYFQWIEDGASRERLGLDQVSGTASGVLSVLAKVRGCRPWTGSGLDAPAIDL